MEVTFKKWRCVVTRGFYANGRTALQLIDKADGSPVAKATVNIEYAEIGEAEVVIKNYSENEGMLEALVAAGVVGKPHRFISLKYGTHWIEVPVCELLLKEATA